MKLRAPRHQPRKRFGQNFLKDGSIVARIADAVSPGPDDHLVEVGPGLGALTEALLPIGCRLDALELDRDLTTPLLAAFSIYPNFTLHQADALQFDFAALAREPSSAPSDRSGRHRPGTHRPGKGEGEAERTGEGEGEGEGRGEGRGEGERESQAVVAAKPARRLRIVGNLPYNISTPLIFHLLHYTDQIEDMHFMLQLEVVQRLTAEPGTGHWGRLAIMTQFRAQTELLFEVPPESFDPPPKVQSAIVRLTPHRTPPYPDCDEDKLARVVKAAFAQRRKTLRNNLKGLIDAQALEAASIDPSARAETLSMEDFVRLADQLRDTD